MQKYSFKQVDAFTDRPLSGNPCAIVYGAEDLDAEIMLRISKAMNLSETSFVLVSDRADFKVRYFTTSREIPLAGHPTIATVHSLIEDGRVGKSAQNVTLEMKAGIIDVAIERGERSCLIKMRQLKPQFLRTYDREHVAHLFGLSESDLIENAPVQTVSTGTPSLVIPVKSLEVLRRIEMKVGAYKEFREAGDFFSPHCFCLESVSGEALTFARHLGTPPESFEDPFTGSSTGCMASYLYHHRLIDQVRFYAEQGHWMDRPGRALVELQVKNGQIESVSVGGTAVTTLKGELIL